VCSAGDCPAHGDPLGAAETRARLGSMELWKASEGASAPTRHPSRSIQALNSNETNDWIRLSRGLMIGIGFAPEFPQPTSRAVESARGNQV